MLVIKTKNIELLKKVACVAQQLKCIVKSEEINMSDLTRIDLFTEIGIERQVHLLMGDYKKCDLLKKIKINSAVLASPKNCFKICFNDNFIASKFITREYLNAVNHYFGKKITLILINNSLFCESKSPVLASFFYRAIFTDAYDYYDDFNKVKFFAAKEVLKEILFEKPPLFLSCEKILNYFGQSIIHRDVINSLKKFGYKLISFVKKEGYLIRPPFFRTDIYSASDILEDIMLFNLNKFEGNKEIRIRKRINDNSYYDISAETIIAKKLLNFGFKELCLNCHKGLPLATSIEKDALFRSLIVPSLLNYEISNQHMKYPHRLFELGSVLNNSRQNVKLGILMSQSKADFNEMYSIIYSIFFNSFSKEIYLKESDSAYYEKGASFDIMENKNKLGTIGILSLKFAKTLKLRESCICSEISIGSITTGVRRFNF